MIVKLARHVYSRDAYFSQCICVEITITIHLMMKHVVECNQTVMRLGVVFWKLQREEKMARRVRDYGSGNDISEANGNDNLSGVGGSF